MKKLPVILQILALCVTISSFATYLYVNKISPFNKKVVTEVFAEELSFRRSDDIRPATEEETDLALEFISGLHENGKVSFEEKPQVLNLGPKDSKQMVVRYFLNDASLPANLEIIDLTDGITKSIYHYEGEDIEYHLLYTSENGSVKKYFLVGDRTGATGKYLSMYFLEYDGFGKIKLADSISDMYNTEIFPLRNKLTLRNNDIFYEIVESESGLEKILYDMTRSAGLRLVTYGKISGMWNVNDSRTGTIHHMTSIIMQRGEEILIIKDSSPENDAFSVNTILDGNGLEFFKGSPTTIVAKELGEGRILLVDETVASDPFEIQVKVNEQ